MRFHCMGVICVWVGGSAGNFPVRSWHHSKWSCGQPQQRSLLPPLCKDATDPRTIDAREKESPFLLHETGEQDSRKIHSSCWHHLRIKMPTQLIQVSQNWSKSGRFGNYIESNQPLRLCQDHPLFFGWQPWNNETPTNSQLGDLSGYGAFGYETQLHQLADGTRSSCLQSIEESQGTFFWKDLKETPSPFTKASPLL